VFYALKGILEIDPWYSPQYLFPLLGMVLGNTINGISLGLDRFMDSLSVRRKEVETLLSLGATSWEAVNELVRDALRTSLIPTINSMLVMGIVSLPGMMTGQILAGISPGEAVRYQIIVVFIIAAAAALSSTVVIILAFKALFSSNHQLLYNRIRKVS
jgi:putative ABC transport system permease protein